MRIAIVGPGAMGALFGGFLAQAGHEVWLLARRPETAAAIEEQGITVEGLAGFTAQPAAATHRPERIPAVDLALVLVKSYDTGRAAEAIAAFSQPPAAVLTLQNGAGNAATLAGRLGRARLLAGTTSLGAIALGPGRVRLAGTGDTLVGRPGEPPDEQVQAIAQVFTAAGLPTRPTDRVEEAIWRKLIVNCAINAPAALARVPNGAVFTSDGLAGVASAAAAEAAALGQAQGFITPPGEMIALARQVAAQTAANHNSMLQDVLARRRTEIGAMNRFVADEAPSHGLAAPTNGLLASLIEGLEQSYPVMVLG